jgi:hypothetical protein
MALLLLSGSFRQRWIHFLIASVSLAFSYVLARYFGTAATPTNDEKKAGSERKQQTKNNNTKTKTPMVEREIKKTKESNETQ